MLLSDLPLFMFENVPSLSYFKTFVRVVVLFGGKRSKSVSDWFQLVCSFLFRNTFSQ